MHRIHEIKPSDKAAEQLSRERWDSIAKPLGSLGLLENAVERIAGIQESADVDISRRSVVVMCADNGVVCEGVTQSDSSVTALCAAEIARGNSSVNRLAECFGADVAAVDIGINRDVREPLLIMRKIAYGTQNITRGAAMTIAQAQRALCIGMDIARGLKDSGVKLIITGEMGIGNTTTASALASVLLSLPPRDVTGRGAGLDSRGLERKISAVERAIAVNQPDAGKPLELLAKLGGFDIAGMTGLFLGGAYYRIPVIIDGVISAAAALIACRISPYARDFMLASHVSAEPAGALLLKELGLKPLICAEMHLGEGTGGVMLLPLLDGALKVYGQAHRFDDIKLERYERLI